VVIDAGIQKGRLRMDTMQSRRDFLAGLSAAGAVGARGARASRADEGPPEVTTIRIPKLQGICLAPLYVSEELLRAEGFTDIRFVETRGGAPNVERLAHGDLDFSMVFAPPLLIAIDAGEPITVLAGVHSGCFELFAQEPIRTFSDLKGRNVGIERIGSSNHVLLAIMAAQVGIDPHTDINWITGPRSDYMALFAAGKVDAFLATPPESLEVRVRKVGRVILNSTEDRPWSQYFCCMLAGNADFIHEHPAATKRVLRAALKATDLCASDPQRVSQQLVDRGFAQRYDYALQTLTELPYGSWREFDPEDSMRFYALRMHEIGFISSSPNAILAAGTDWRFLNELKRELKA
jgi:NitT/TauT family transport system substrate-binding protein